MQQSAAKGRKHSKFELLKTVLIFSIIIFSYSTVANYVVPEKPQSLFIVKYWNKIVGFFSNFDQMQKLKKNDLRLIIGTPSNPPRPASDYKVNVTPSNPPPVKRAVKVKISKPSS